jgi:tetratricopeptide (TPR) repeat protein
MLFGQFTAREYFKIGKNKFDEGKYYEAVDFFDKAVDEDPAYENALFLRGQSFLALKRYKLAIDDFSKIIDHKSNYDIYSAEYFSKRGIARTELQDFESAEKDFIMAIKLRPDFAETYYEYSRYKFLTFYDKNEAIREINKAIQLDPTVPEYYIRRAEYKIALAKFHPRSREIYESALRDASKAIEMEPDNVEYYMVRTIVNKERGEQMEAVRDYNKMIELDPDQVEAYTERGIIKMQNDLYKSAIQDFSRSIELNENNEQNYRYRALCRHNSLDFSGAYDDYSRSIKLLQEQYNFSDDEEKEKIKRVLADTYLKRGVAATSLGNSFNACADFKMAYELGSNLGLNYLRKYCGI